MGKGKRSREPGGRRRTILQIDSNKISRSSSVRAQPADPTPPAVPPTDTVDDQVAEFLREISALEQDQDTAKKSETEENHPATDLTLPTATTSASLSETTQQSSGPPLPGASSSQAVLPEGWDKIFDANSGYHYFWNVHTNETRWDPPQQNPVGLSLISSAYSESDSDSPVSNQPAVPASERDDKKRETLQQNKIHVEDTREDKKPGLKAGTTDQKQRTENVSLHQKSVVYRHTSDSEGNSDSLKPKAKRARENPKPLLLHSSTQTEEAPEKPTEDALRPLIQQLAAELTHKLDFLGISVQQLNQLQAMQMQLETRISDWRSGYLPSEYTLSRIQESARVLCEYEQSAAPVGWGCTWDPSSQRYQYVQVSSGVTMWEYPATAASMEVLGDEDMVLSGGESDDHPPLPPMPPSPSGPPPPPSSQNGHNSAADTKPTPPPLPSTTPPLPDLPPTHTPDPPPLPELRESTLPDEPPPLPPSGQDDVSSPPLPPCPEVATPPLPPSDTSSHMSQSPSTIPNSPCPPSEPETNPQDYVASESYNMSHYNSATQYYTQPEQLMYTYYTPLPFHPTTQTNTPPVADSPSVSPTYKAKGKGKKASNTSSLATHAVSVKKKGMANMLEKWQQLSTVETSSGESESELEEENNLKQRIEDWKKEQVVSGRAKENANFHNIRGNWKDKIQRMKRTQQSETSLLISKQTEG